MQTATKPILVVDDEVIVRESIRDWLKDAGYQVEMAETGEEALEMAAKKEFSVVILDFRLPGKDGVTVLRELRTLKPQTKCIMITAFPSAKLTADLTQLGALDDFLIKPVMMADLEKLVRENLAKLEAGE